MNNLTEQELEQRRLAKIDAKILPPELKEKPKTWKQVLREYFLYWWYRITNSKKKYIWKGITPQGAPTYDPRVGFIETTPDPTAYEALVRPRGEVYSPRDQDTPADICERMSQAATDHEFERVIVYPIEGDRRKAVLKLLESEEGQKLYPMFEYLPANIVGNDALNHQSIIYKYGGRSHFTKPI
jgi:hypothetical protein